jgi:3-phenylpropionate/trans-cinnamate dioxygenase ferredoxin reductase component
MSTSGMVIVGAGEAGARAAIGLRELGWTGRITLIGKEKHFPYERPPLSKQHLTDDEEPVQAVILNDNLLKEHQIEFLAGRTAEWINRENHLLELSDGHKLQYERMLLTTGAVPRKVTLPGSGIKKISYLRTFADSLRIRQNLKTGRHIAIIGGGFIGLEVAASAIQRGCMVTLVEAAPRILMRGVPEEIANMVKTLHSKNGVAFKIGVSILGIDESNDTFTINLADGESIVCDVVIAGIGAVPETSLAEVSGLEIENGIRVNEQLMTSDSDIFAAGDCCSFPHPLYEGRRLRLEAYRNAQEQGMHAAQNMLLTPTPYTAIPWFWSDQYDQTLQVAGLLDEGSKKVVREFGEEGKIYFHLSEDNILKAVSGMGTYRGIAKEMLLAEKLIEKQAKLEPEYLANPFNSLKKLLRA